MKPIIFSALMVRKILDGKKTQTRRPIKEANFAPRGRPPRWAEAVCRARDSGYIAWERGIINDLATFTKEQYARGFEPRYNVGDRLWVREPWQIVDSTANNNVLTLTYEASGNEEYYVTVTPETWAKYGGAAFSSRKRTARFMPHWAARLFLDVIAVRPERLLDITEADAQAEGFADRAEFLSFWDTLYAKKPQLQAAKNPWVWVYGFRQI